MQTETRLQSAPRSTGEIPRGHPAGPRAAALAFLFTLVALLPAEAAWRQWNGPEPPVVSRLASVDGTLFLGTDEADAGNVYRSTDDGTTWANAGLPNPGVFLIHGHQGKVYVGTYIDGLQRSTDGGQNWSQVTGGLPTDGSFAAMAANEGSLFVAANEFSHLQIYRSTDGGASWAAPPGSPFCQVRSMLYANGAVFAGSIDQGILRSTDNGSNWSPANGGLPANPIAGALALAEDGVTILAGVYVRLNPAALGLYRSTDAGATWTKVSADLPVSTALRFASMSVRPGVIDAGLNGEFGGVGLYRSVDGGFHWAQIGSNLPVPPKVEAVLWHEGALFAGTPTGAYRTTDDGAHWTYAAQGASAVRGVASLLEVGSTLYVGLTRAGGGGRGVWRTSDLGESWSGDPESPDMNTAAESLLRDEGGLLAAFYGLVRGVYRSTDGGATWTPSTAGIASSTILHTLFRSGGVHFAGAWEALYRSTNGGSSWTSVPGIDNVKTMAELSGALYAGRYGSGVSRSTNQGLSWSDMSAGLPSGSGRYVNWLAVFNGSLYAATQGAGVYRWSGTSWTFSGLASESVACLLPVSGVLLAGTSGSGVSFSENGSTWVAFNDNLTPDAVTMLATVGGYLVAGTNGDALWGRPLSELPGTAGIGELPAEPGLSLRQIGPNPLREGTRIAWRMPSAGAAQIGLYAASGRRLRSVASGWFAPGAHEIGIDAAGLPAGVVYCRVAACGRSESRTFLVVR